MFKLLILIEPQEDWLNFEQAWPQFLALAEKMPGLVRETTSPIHARLHGSLPVSMVHELYFESRQALKAAMSSAEGVAAQSLRRGGGGPPTVDQACDRRRV